MILYNQLPEELKRDIEKVSKKVDVKAREIIVNVGDRMDFVPFIMDGSVRVFIENDDVNKELLLYYVEGGQTCMMSMIAGFTNKTSKVSAETEIDTTLMLVPTDKIRKWQIKYDEWNNLILNLFLDRYDDLISTIDELSFKKVEDRLIKYLDNYKDQSGSIKINKTFKEIARDIASSREVVSRSLKKLQNDNKIKFA
jgi:CRP/FNR family transcriptional regulator, anaerobic regulatory protein